MTGDGSTPSPSSGTGSGIGTVPAALQFSDRAGEESLPAYAAPAPSDPLVRALRTLDTIVETDETTGTSARTATADGTTGTSASTATAEATSATTGTPAGADDTSGASAEPLVAAGAEAARSPGTPEQPPGTGPDLRRAATVPAPEEDRPASVGENRREAILDGASALFGERGYHGASLRDISRKVGISHPGMLHHFASKDALLDGVIDRLEAHAQGLLDATDRLSSSPQALEAALGGPWDPKQHPMALMATLSAEIVDADHPGRFRIARLRLVHEHILKQVLAHLADGGHLREGADPAFIARSTFSLLLSLAVREKSVRALQQEVSAEPVHDVREFVRHYLLK